MKKFIISVLIFTISFTNWTSCLAKARKITNSPKKTVSRSYARKTTKKPKHKKIASTKKATYSTISRRIVASRGTSNYGELLDWTYVNRIFPIGSMAKIFDISTGKSFYIIRTYGHLHADVEAASKEDTEIIKSIWNGFSWERRPVIVEVNGRRIAASMTAMPHAGIDSQPAGQIVSNRSGGYGTGENLDKIKGNGMDGHMDIHFLNSRRHKDGAIDPEHQQMIKRAAGLR
ncbi:hypothetical protein SAMN05660865_00588 [Caloramator fervidus]|uniref:Uncharacterized protein n=1 Tax=Caloramator fervidus TaxID=29344 RepID=A0A1H5TB69_9CLOT|nr:hypothetical protein [Caloramator fervidus]SEF60004.1 hypothetical protein SAMN05660865_00588 [Caloramator fervidus]